MSRVGRPREFNTNEVLERAIRQFSAHGYHGTSVSDLNKALGLPTGSIYKAWGDKRGLLRAALERYIDIRSDVIRDAVASQPDGLSKIAAALGVYALASSGSAGRIGCLVIEATAELFSSDPEIARRLVAQTATTRNRFHTWLSEAVADGSVSKDIDLLACADTLLALTQGMRVMGKAGATEQRMRALIDQFVQMMR